MVAPAVAGDTAQVQTLLAANAPVDHTNMHGETVLSLASAYRHIAPMKLLLRCYVVRGRAGQLEQTTETYIPPVCIQDSTAQYHMIAQDSIGYHK